MGQLDRPNTVRFNVRQVKSTVTPHEIHAAVNKELHTATTMKCIAELENGWFNVSFNNENDCVQIATRGMILQQTLIQCERANVQNSAVIYVKAPYEMSDQIVVNVISSYGTVVNIRRQHHSFDEDIETGVRSCLVKNLKKPIPSYVKVGGFTLPVRYRGQRKTCKICEEPGHLARDCPTRGRCFVCGSLNHQANWHDNNRTYADTTNESDQEDRRENTQVIIIPRKQPANTHDKDDGDDGDDDDNERR